MQKPDRKKNFAARTRLEKWGPIYTSATLAKKNKNKKIKPKEIVQLLTNKSVGSYIVEYFIIDLRKQLLFNELHKNSITSACEKSDTFKNLC